jgi:catechol 2,3-dioxygenase-like lactoylglutathione lyase family enzyme
MSTTSETNQTARPTTIVGYSHVAIGVSDLEEARAFYCDLLGLEVLPRPDFGVPGLWLRAGNSMLHVVAIGGSRSANTPAWHIALQVRTESFDDVIETMRTAGVRFRAEPSVRVDYGITVRAATVIDPWDNFIEFTDLGLEQTDPEMAWPRELLAGIAAPTVR